MEEWERSDSLVPAWDPAEVARRYAVLRQAVRLPGDGTLRLVARPGWVAVATEDGLPSRGDADRIAAMSRRQGRGWLWALLLDDLDPHDAHGNPIAWPAVCDVAATPDGVRLVRRMAQPVHYALLPADAAWVVLALMRDDRGLVLGPAATVAEILACSIASAHHAYQQAADDQRGRDPLAAARIDAEVEQLRDRYPRLAAGDALALDAPWATWVPPGPATA